MHVYFQKEKSMLDADITFFLDRIENEYEALLKVSPNRDWWSEDMSLKQLEQYFNRSISTIRKAIRKMCQEGYEQYRYYKDHKIIISKSGVEWLCKNCFKQKHLELLEIYKVELTEKFIAAGYIYDNYYCMN